MSNQWTLTGPGGSLNVVWPADAPLVEEYEVIGMTQTVIGRPYEVFRHFGARNSFTLHHIFSDRPGSGSWDNMWNVKRALAETLTGVPVAVDFLATLTGPESYSITVAIMRVRTVIPQPPFVKTYRLEIECKRVTL